MKLTNEQFNALQPYEGNFITATRSQWSRHPGSVGLKTIVDVWNAVTGENRRVNGSCQSCILNLLVDCGILYLADKEEREKAQAKKKATHKKKA